MVLERRNGLIEARALTHENGWTLGMLGRRIRTQLAVLLTVDAPHASLAVGRRGGKQTAIRGERHAVHTLHLSRGRTDTLERLRGVDRRPS